MARFASPGLALQGKFPAAFMAVTGHASNITGSPRAEKSGTAILLLNVKKTPDFK
jgi:hypothetical protein